MADPLTDAQLAVARAKIGDSEPPTDEDLADQYERLGSLTAVVVEVIEKRIATLASGGPLDFTVVGEYSEDRSKNLMALERLLKMVKTEGINGEGPVLGRVTVGNLGRRWGR